MFGAGALAIVVTKSLPQFDAQFPQFDDKCSRLTPTAAIGSDD